MILFGYFRNPCIHESAEALVSLHHTKAGAWRAMRAAMFDAAMEEREFAIRFGGRQMMRDAAPSLRFEAFRVRPVEVLP